jgi:hypothetical protein
VYGDNFFKRRVKKYHDKEILIAKIFHDIFQPHSVCDVGCAIGSYLEGFRFCGVKERNLCGYEKFAEVARKYAPQKIRDCIQELDAGESLQASKRYALVLCIEVAEHLPGEKAQTLINNLTGLKANGGHIILTAAAPGQPGTGHINCQSMPYWYNLAKNAGITFDTDKSFRVIDALGSVSKPLDIAKNLMVFR